MRALELRSAPGSPSTTRDIGTVVCESQVLDVKDTVLDPDVLQRGASVDLPEAVRDVLGRKISRVDMPPMSEAGRTTRTGGMIFLSNISIAFNAILRALEEVPRSPSQIQGRVLDFQMQIINRIRGPDGVIARGVVGTRMSHSARLVLIFGAARTPDWVGLHKGVMETIGAEEGDLVLVCRDPVIWDGSWEVLRAYPTEEYVMTLHPLLAKQFAADADGDTMAVVLPDKENHRVMSEVRAHLVAFCKRYAVWPKILCPENLSPLPEWEEIGKDGEPRFEVTGLSYGPRDVLKPSNNAKLLENLTGKSFLERNSLISKGDPAVSLPIILETSQQNLTMKVDLGPVGALGRRLLLLADTDPWLVRPASVVSEAIQQSKLHSKHDVEGLDAAEVSDMFERRGRFRDCPLQEVFDVLSVAGIERKAAEPIILHVFIELPYWVALKRAGAEGTFGRPLVRRHLMTGDPEKEELDYELANRLGVSLGSFRALLADSITGLRDYIRENYPGYSIISREAGSSGDVALDLYQRVFVKEQEDAGSIFTVVQGTLGPGREVLEATARPNH